MSSTICSGATDAARTRSCDAWTVGANDGASQPLFCLDQSGILQEEISRRDVAARIAVHRPPSIDEWRRRTGIEPA